MANCPMMQPVKVMRFLDSQGIWNPTIYRERRKNARIRLKKEKISG